MPKWNIISKQTREVMGVLEAESQSGAMAKLEKQADARYYELSAVDRGSVAPPEDLELSPSQMAEVLRRWAVAEKGFPEGTEVRLLANGQYMPMSELRLLTFVGARVLAPGRGNEPGADSEEEDSDEEVVVGTSQE